MHKIPAMRTHSLFPLFFVLAACGQVAVTQEDLPDPAPTSPVTTTSPPDSEPQGAAWTLRDDTPYARVGHSAVLDEGRDRMIVFGGGANDVWELPLSGPHANQWSELVVAGEHPPVHTYGSTLFLDSAVYDPAGERMIVLLNPLPSTANETSDVAVWELSLSGTPSWRRLVTEGPSPGSEVQSGRLALDRDGNRLFVVGGALDHAGVWTLSLGETPVWSRFADTPGEELGAFYADASLVLDAERGQLVLFGGHPRLGKMWGLSLATGQWTLLDEGTSASRSYGVTTVLDAASDRLVLLGGDIHTGASLFSLETHEWTTVDPGGAGSSHVGASGVADPQRGRVLYFSGAADEGVVNTTWALSLDALSLSELVPGTRRADFRMGQRAAVWDPIRSAVVAFGDFQGGDTWLHGLAPSDAWTSLPAGTTPPVSFLPAIHDPVGEAVIAFGGYQYKESKEVLRLPSSPGAAWETVPVADGPVGRSQHVAVYDGLNQRMIVHGGWYDSSYSNTEVLGDVWALSLDGAPAWTELAPSGPTPANRRGHVAIYDPEAHRMIMYGGSTAGGSPYTDLWSLSLGAAPEWTLLAPSGAGPGVMDHPSAVHDVKGGRMILLEVGGDGARVFALDLGATPAWHRFCWDGITPAESWDFPGSAPDAVITPDGLFVTVSGGAFRFDLATPYCE